jgi:hypothetical protein
MQVERDMVVFRKNCLARDVDEIGVDVTEEQEVLLYSGSGSGGRL